VTSSSDEQLGGGFAEVRDGVHVTTVIRPERDRPEPESTP